MARLHELRCGRRDRLDPVRPPLGEAARAKSRAKNALPTRHCVVARWMSPSGSSSTQFGSFARRGMVNEDDRAGGDDRNEKLCPRADLLFANRDARLPSEERPEDPKRDR